jgi:hypothetical protein
MNNTLLPGIIGHLVGDYLLQTDWMAQNKKLRSWPCLVHCVIWTACVCIFAGWGWLAAAFLLACHFAQEEPDWLHASAARAVVAHRRG